jgi:hypothetical protein
VALGQSLPSSDPDLTVQRCLSVPKLSSGPSTWAFACTPPLKKMEREESHPEDSLEHMFDQQYLQYRGVAGWAMRGWMTDD